eukprot:416171_1
MALVFNFAKFKIPNIRINKPICTRLHNNKLTIPFTLQYISKSNLWPAIHRIVPHCKMVEETQALKGRDKPLIDSCSNQHTVLKTSTKPPFPDDTETIIFGMGCFWGAERIFWKLPNIYSTQVGYAGGYTLNPIYEEVCTGQTGHTEAVRVVYDPQIVSLSSLLTVFFNEHNPCDGFRQGNDIGTQYRSAIYWTTTEQAELIRLAADAFGQQLPDSVAVTSELAPLKEFYYAEDYHQQYLDKNPGGYCGITGTRYKLPDLDKFKDMKDKNHEKDDV